MKKIQIKKVEERLKERFDICKSFNNKADEVYLKGMIEILNVMGYEVVDNGNEVKILPM